MKDPSVIIEDILARLVPGQIASTPSAMHLVTGVGQRSIPRSGDDGFAIERVKEWAPGERPDYVATSKVGWTRVLTTVYQVSQRLGIYLLPKRSLTMQFGTQRVHKDVLAAELMAEIIACSAVGQDDIAYMAWSESAVDAQLPLRAARYQMLPVLSLYLEERGYEPFRPGTPTGLSQALGLLPRRRCLVFVILDWTALSASDLDALNHVAGVHDVCCLIVDDPRERELPEGQGARSFQDLLGDKTAHYWLSEAGRKSWNAEYQKAQKQLLEKLHAAGCATVCFGTESDPMERMAVLLSGQP